MKAAIVIQARMSSQRFPGKVLKKVKGRCLLSYVIERLKNCAHGLDIFVCTSTEESDDAIVSFCEAEKINCFRGSLNNVLKRFVDLATENELDALIRVSGDSPMIDPALVDQAFVLFKNLSVDLVTNIQERSFPMGQSVEIISSSSLKKVLSEISDEEDLEHVTPYFYKNADKFEIMNFTSEKDYSKIKMTVDTAEDLKGFDDCLNLLDRDLADCGYEDLITYFEKKPDEKEVEDA